MERTFSFGKYAISNNRKENEVTITICLKKREEGMVFSASGEAWNRLHTDILLRGQCLDTLKKYVHNPLFREIYRLWKSYHLNDMNTGTPEQEDLLIQHFGKKAYKYEDAVNYLKGCGLYEVTMADGSKFRYGSKWLFRPIPQEDLDKIEALIKK